MAEGNRLTAGMDGPFYAVERLPEPLCDLADCPKPARWLVSGLLMGPTPRKFCGPHKAEADVEAREAARDLLAFMDTLGLRKVS